MDIFSCESQMTAASYSDENTEYTDDSESYYFRARYGAIRS